MSSKKILIVTYYWPPSGGVGVQRWMNFALQLQKKGWTPIILTPENPQFDIKDKKLEKRVENITTHKIPIWEPFQFFHSITGGREKNNVQQGLVMEKGQRTFTDKLSVWVRGNIFLPDPRVFWVRKASTYAIELVKKEGVSIVITTGPPHSIHLIGKRIKRKTNIKWLADFRDPWSKWDVLQKLNTSSLAMKIHRSLESSVIRHADQITTVSGRLAESLNDADVINNGVTFSSDKDVDQSEAKFTIGYFGMLNELRNPKQFWMMLDQMCRENTDFAGKLHINIGGIVSASIKEDVLKFHELKDRVHFLGYLSHEQILKEYKKCNMLLLLLNKSNNSKWILPVKFFEYLTAKRMILCLGPRESDLGDIINKKDIGEIISYNDIASMRAFIEDVFEHYRKPSLADITELLEQFSHKNLVEKLDQLLLELYEN